MLFYVAVLFYSFEIKVDCVKVVQQECHMTLNHRAACIEVAYNFSIVLLPRLIKRSDTFYARFFLSESLKPPGSI